ncbi:hypothetical protein NQ314_014463 [Rhamnusium bicolor]|uniref:DDE Tnp4 domain-containing protein n=1 Tax=Rhamnusium bicolor TaxID=1586634 RepID=A0AAV8X285_9CUCU|nr:hypothetical protein NQ314_014463 [Rhamnusium bicolor]
MNGNQEAFYFVIDMLLDDDEDDEETRLILQKVWGFAEETVPNFSDRQFHSHFRMTPTTFEDILRKMHAVAEINVQAHAGGNPETPIEKQLLIALWYMSNIESFRGVADRFGVSSSTAWHSLYKICRMLLQCNTAYHIISFPNENRCNETINHFQNKTGFPGIAGAVDGSHIPIIAPKESAASYINRKGFHSVLLQGVCDEKKMFIDCYAGDSAYSLTTKLLVPYKDNGHLTNIEKNFNKQHSKCRVYIEQTFAYLKGRFRRLKLLEAVRLDLIPLIIICACILHNICQGSNDVPPDVNIYAEVEEERVMNPENENIQEPGNNPLLLPKEIILQMYYILDCKN